MDYKKEIEKLKEQIRKLEKEEEETETKIMLEKYGLKIGDTVEFELDESDEDDWYPTYWSTGVIFGFWNGRVKVQKKDGHTEYIDIKEVNIFDENDYTLRHKMWKRPLEPGDKIKIIVEKEDLILGKIYEVDSIFRHKNKSEHCGIFNERRSVTHVYPNEYHITNAKH